MIREERARNRELRQQVDALEAVVRNKDEVVVKQLRAASQMISESRHMANNLKRELATREGQLHGEPPSFPSQ
jgi:hypothetical protein